MSEIKIDEDDNLLCPNCGHHNLHHEEVWINNRYKEDGDGVSIVVGSMKKDPALEGMEDRIEIKHHAADSGAFMGRRHDLSVWFWCEGCPEKSQLVIKQHKGCSTIAWGPR